MFSDRLGYISLLEWNSCLIFALHSHTSAVSMEVHYMFLTPSVAFCAFNPVYLLFLEIVLICRRIYDFDFGKCWKFLYRYLFISYIICNKFYHILWRYCRRFNMGHATEGKLAKLISGKGKGRKSIIWHAEVIWQITSIISWTKTKSSCFYKLFSDIFQLWSVFFSKKSILDFQRFGRAGCYLNRTHGF